MPGVRSGNLTVSSVHTAFTLAAVVSIGVYAKLPLVTVFARKGNSGTKETTIDSRVVRGYSGQEGTQDSKQAWKSEGATLTSDADSNTQSKMLNSRVLLSERSLKVAQALDD